MQIPIEIIVVTISTIVLAVGSLIGIVVKAMTNNTEAINNIKEWMAERETAAKYESNECENQHKYINRKFKEHGDKIEDHEKRLNKAGI